MRPKPPEGNGSDDLFRARLSSQLDLKHPLVRLAELLDWRRFETAFGALYHETAGRPGKPMRLMVGLTYLKHTYNLSDEEVCARWVENPYWQFFCGFDYLQHQLPILAGKDQADQFAGITASFPASAVVIVPLALPGGPIQHSSRSSCISSSHTALTAAEFAPSSR